MEREKHSKFSAARDKAEGVCKGQITSLDFTVMATGSHQRILIWSNSPTAPTTADKERKTQKREPGKSPFLLWFKRVNEKC